jgi:hypothetical protein
VTDHEKKPAPTTAGGTDLYWLAALVAVVVGIAAVLIAAPATTIEKLFALLERLPAAAWGGIGTALSGLVVAVWRSRTGGGGPPTVPPAAVAALLALALSSQIVGCGASAFRVHYDAIHLAAETTGAASEVVYGATRAKIDHDCPAGLAQIEYAECAARAALPWRDAQTAIGALRLALGSWYEAVAIAEEAGDDDPDALRAAMRAAAALVRAYADLVDLLADREVVIPALPEAIVALARGVEVD